MRQLDPVVLSPTRYRDPLCMVKEYRAWFLGNVNRRVEFVDRVDFLRTAMIGRFLLMWLLCDLFEDMATIQSGKRLMTTILPD